MILRFCEGGWAEGGWAGLHMGAPSPPCHSATTRQRSSHNAPGQPKGGILPCPAASLPGRQPEDIQEEVLEAPVEFLGGRLEAGGWTRLLEVLHCEASSWRGHLQSPPDGGETCFSPQGTDASSSADDKNHQPHWQDQGNAFWRST